MKTGGFPDHGDGPPAHHRTVRPARGTSPGGLRPPPLALHACVGRARDGPRRSGPCSADRAPGGRDDQPRAAELDHVLTEDLPRPAIVDVVVQRVAGVGDLLGAAPTCGGPELRLVEIPPRDLRPVGVQRWPGASAIAVAAAFAAAIAR